MYIDDDAMMRLDSCLHLVIRLYLRTMNNNSHFYLEYVYLGGGDGMVRKDENVLSKLTKLLFIRIIIETDSPMTFRSDLFFLGFFLALAPQYV